MPADHKAFTIVTAFLGMVMFGFWIAHACALYHPDQPAVQPQYRIQVLAEAASNGMPSVRADIPLSVIAEG